MNALTVSMAMLLATTPSADESVVREALTAELQRAMESLELEGLGRPHYLAYTVYEHDGHSARASFGSLVASNRSRRRTLRVSLRVGDESLDSGNFIAGFDSIRPVVATLPLDDDLLALRRAIWLATDRAYKRGAELLEKKRAAREGKPLPDDYAGELSQEEPVEFHVTTSARSPDPLALESLVQAGSAPFRSHSDVQSGDVSASATRATRVFIASDGSSVIDSAEFFTIEVSASTQADDGMPLGDFERFAGSSFDALPTPETLAEAATRVAERVDVFRKAPRADDYSGPVLFASVAAGQLLQRTLLPQLIGAPAVEAEDARFASMLGGESEWSGKVGRRVLPPFVSVVDDATVTRAGDAPLFAAYNVDEEGIPARRVTLIEKGKVVGFVMSRQPRKGFEHSTGHGRGGAGALPRAHTSNVLVEVTGGKSAERLDKELLKRAKAEGLDRGLIIERLVMGGASHDGHGGMPGMGQRRGPVAAVAWLVDAKGHRTPVRGLSLGEVTASNLKDIVAAGREPVVYSDVARTAFGGSVRSSVMTPALLFEELDAKEPEATDARPPVLERPAIGGQHAPSTMPTATEP